MHSEVVSGVLIVAGVSALAIWCNRKEIVDSFKGRRGVGDFFRAVLGATMAVAFFVTLVPEAIRTLLSFLPESPGVY